MMGSRPEVQGASITSDWILALHMKACWHLILFPVLQWGFWLTTRWHPSCASWGLTLEGLKHLCGDGPITQLDRDTHRVPPDKTQPPLSLLSLNSILASIRPKLGGFSLYSLDPIIGKKIFLPSAPPPGLLKENVSSPLKTDLFCNCILCLYRQHGARLTWLWALALVSG